MSQRNSFPAPILMLHHVEPAPLRPEPAYPDSYLTPEAFEALLDLLERLGRTPLSLADAVARWRRGETLPRRPIILTFDDGCRCFADHAWPALARRRWPATLFVVADELGGHNRWDTADGERREDLLDADALRALADQGLDIGCHSLTHADLSLADAATLHRETIVAKARLEDALQRPVPTFCYPYGHTSHEAAQAVQAAGFDAAVVIDTPPWASSSAPAPAATLPFVLQREIITPRDSPFELRLKATGWYRHWRKLPRLGILKALRSLRT